MKRLTRFTAISDSHGDHIDPKAEAAARAFVADFKPHHKIHLGDCFDLRALRSGASQDEKQEGVGVDVAAGLALLDWYQPDVWLRGNHDERLWKCAEQSRDGNLQLLATQLIDRIEARFEVKGRIVKPYCKRNGIYEWGGVTWLHGYSGGVNATRQTALSYGTSCHGHTHVPAGPVPVERSDGAVGYSCGCLCKLDLGYNAAHQGTLRQGQGFIYGWLDSAGRAILNHARPIGGRWVFPTEFNHAA